MRGVNEIQIIPSYTIQDVDIRTWTPMYQVIRSDWFLRNLINGSFQNALFYVYLKPVHISQRRRYSVRTL